MRIVQVVLQNVKSYADTTTISLLPGINAICGQNGAGKSTILEAVGFTLFGYRPYKLDAFLREGEKSGSITVTVEDDGGCPYHIVRKLGSSAGQIVYNELNQKVAEGEADVSEWRKSFFGLEVDVKLDDLFSDTIGPPQGTLTAIFLEPPGPRKVKFDQLLGITEYRDAAEGLREVRNLFEQQATDADRRAALLEGDVRRLPELEVEHLTVSRRMGELGSSLAALSRRQTELSAERERLEAAQKAVQKAETDMRLAESRAADASRREREHAEELRHAQEAAQRVEEASAGSRSYEEATQRLKQLGERRRQRDDLVARHHAATRNALEWEQRVGAARERLEALDRDEALAAEKAAQVAEQERVETAVRHAEERVRARAEAVRQLPGVEARLQELLQRADEAAKQLSAVEAARPSASRLEEAREQARVLRDELAKLERQEWALKQASDGLIASEGRLSQLSHELERLQAELGNLRPLQAVAAAAGERQQSRDGVSAELAGLRAQTTEAQLSRKQVEGGLCPFLHETCRNLRPGVSLEDYFDGLISERGSKVAGLEALLARAEAALHESRLAEKSLTRLPDIEHQAAQLLKEREGLEQQVASLRQQEELLQTASEDKARTLDELQRVEAELPVAEEASRIVSGEAGWRRQREDALQAKQREDSLLADLQGLVEREAGAEEELAGARQALAELGSPREKAAFLRQRISQERPIAERDLARAEKNWDTAREVAKRLLQEMEPFGGLEDEMAEASARQEENEAAYRTFLANQSEAARLPQRLQDHQEALKAASDAASAMVAARHAMERIRATYDEEEHLRLVRQLEEVGNFVSSYQTELGLCQEDERRLGKEMAALRRSKVEMETAQLEVAENREMREAVDAIRDVLKRAGPEMTRELLRRVSARATSIYRDLMGQPSVSLEWGADYEIRCRVRAEDREFKQLSGGEQMGAALAIRLALLQTISNIRLAFLDEPTAHMDAARRTNLASQIQNLRSFDQLVVISHDDSFDTLFGHVVHLAKEDGVTVVER